LQALVALQACRAQNAILQSSMRNCLQNDKSAEKAAQEFETLFVDMMVKSMRQTAAPEDSSNAEDIYQGMLDSEYSKSMTTANNFGIREQILNWMEQADPSLKNVNSQNSKSQSDRTFGRNSKSSK